MKTQHYFALSLLLFAMLTISSCQAFLDLAGEIANQGIEALEEDNNQVGNVEFDGTYRGSYTSLASNTVSSWQLRVVGGSVSGHIADQGGEFIPLVGDVNVHGDLEVRGSLNGQARTLTAQLVLGANQQGYVVQAGAWVHNDADGLTTSGQFNAEPLPAEGSGSEATGSAPVNPPSTGGAVAKSQVNPPSTGGAVAKRQVNPPSTGGAVVKRQLAKPERLRVGNVTHTSIDLFWDSVHYARGYNILWRTDSAGPWTNSQRGERYSFSDLWPGTKYYFKVQAVLPSLYGVSVADSDYSEEFSVRTHINLEQPQSLRVVAATPTSIDLEWELVDHGLDYRIWWDTEKDTYGRRAILRRKKIEGPAWGAANIDVTTGRYTIEDLIPQTVYYFKVKALGRLDEDDQNYIDSEYSKLGEHTISVLEQPTMEPPRIWQNQIVLVWFDVDRADGYEIWWSTDADGQGKTKVVYSSSAIEMQGGKLLYATHPNLLSDTKYHFKVKAFGVAGVADSAVRSFSLRTKP